MTPYEEAKWWIEVGLDKDGFGASVSRGRYFNFTVNNDVKSWQFHDYYINLSQKNVA